MASDPYHLTLFKYKVFISYSRTDKAAAQWLQKNLRDYRFPKNLIGQETAFGKIPTKFGGVFLDTTHFAAAGNLKVAIENALSESASLVVVCSPAAAASKYVNEEIEHFLLIGRQNRIFAVIVEGEPTFYDENAARLGAFPPALCSAGIRMEPLAAEMRISNSGNKAKGRVWTDAKLQLIGAIYGLDKENLAQEELLAEQERTKRQRRISQMLASLSLFLLAALSLAVYNQHNMLAKESEVLSIAGERAMSSEHQSYIHATQIALEALPSPNLLGRLGLDRPLVPRAKRLLFQAANSHLPAYILGLETDRFFHPSINPDASLVLAESNGRIAGWDLVTGSPADLFNDQKEEIEYYGFGPEGTFILLIWRSGKAELVDAISNETKVAFSPKGIVPSRAYLNPQADQIAVTNLLGHVQLYDVSTGKLIHDLHSPHHRGLVQGPVPQGYALVTHKSDREYVVFSPNGKLVLILADIKGVTDHNLISLWDTQTGKMLFSRAIDHAVFQMRFHPGGGMFAVSGNGMHTEIWDAVSDKKRFTLEGSSSARQVLFDHEGEYVFISTGKDVRVYRVADGVTVAELEHASEVTSLQVIEDRHNLITASRQGVVQVWNWLNSHEVERLYSSQRWCDQARFNPSDGSIVAICDGYVLRWDSSEQYLQDVLVHELFEESTLAWHSEAIIRVTSSKDTTKVWNRKSGELISCFEGQAQGNRPASEDRIIVNNGQGEYLVYNLKNQEVLHSFPDGRSLRPMFSPSGRYIAYRKARGKPIQVFDARTFQLLKELKDPQDELYHYSFSIDESLFLAGGRGDVVDIWEVDSGKKVYSHHGDGTHSISGAIDPKGEFVVTGNVDGEVWLRWIRSKKTYTFRSVTPKGSVRLVAIDPNGSQVLFSSGKNLHLWNLPFRLRGPDKDVVLVHPNSVTSAAYSKSGKWIATASKDSHVRIWDAKEGILLLSFRGHIGKINRVFFEEDDSRLVSVSADGSLRVWTTSPVRDARSISKRICEKIGQRYGGANQKLRPFEREKYELFESDQSPCDSIGYGLLSSLRRVTRNVSLK